MPPKKKKASSGDGEEGDDRVHVVVRVRPPIRKDEKFGEGSEALQYDKDKNLLFLLNRAEDDKGMNTKQFVFDHVLWKDSGQRDAWDAAGQSVVKSVMQGYTGCVMCYGQTGSGKTFTLANDDVGNEGIMIHAFNHIFAAAAAERELKYECHLSYQQIYLDSISDLLEPSAPVELREDPKDGVYVSGAKWAPVASTEEALKCLQRGNSNRATACTKMNADSSRSHAILIMKVKCTGGVRTLNGMLYLVDLAGSERVKKSGVEGSAFDEAKAINQSLTTLGRCIEVLANPSKKEKPPFREQKLTRLLSNAIGGGAKTTLIVCVAPTMTDQFETVNSLDFGQQAMNVVVRAKINASTDFGSLTASLCMQRDKKYQAIRELEVKVLKELQPQIDGVVNLEHACKKASIECEIAEERVDGQKDRLAAAKAAGERENEEDKARMVALLNERAQKTEELERVLVQLSSDPDLKKLQDQHEKDKSDTMQRSMVLQEELRGAEVLERQERKNVDAKLEGVVHTARNLGQIAAYFFQTGAMAEAADFYGQAKAIFDTLLGPDHPKTLAWQEDLFFLIHAPAIQNMVQKAAKEMQPDSELAQAAEQGKGSAPEWWMQNLHDMGNHDRVDDEPVDNGWWMQNLYDMGYNSGRATGEDSSDYMGVIFGTPRDGTSTARGGAAFTPRGTLVALAQANQKGGAVKSLGMPKQAQDGLLGSVIEEDAINMAFAADWVNKVFLTPRASATSGGNMTTEEYDANMGDALSWLQDNFGGATPRGGSNATRTTPITPRGSQPAGLLNITKESDDAVFHAAMQATLATPRGGGGAVDDKPMAGAVSKMFKGRLQHV